MKFNKESAIAVLALSGITLYVLARFVFAWPSHVGQYILWVVLLLGGVPLVWDLFKKLIKRQFGADLLAGISILTAVLLQEYLAGALVKIVILLPRQPGWLSWKVL